MRSPPPPRDDLRFSNKTGILQVEQETSAPSPNKNPGSACGKLSVHFATIVPTLETMFCVLAALRWTLLAVWLMFAHILPIVLSDECFPAIFQDGIDSQST